jgi:hypothetical protein
MDNKNFSTMFIVGVAVVVLAATIVLNAGVTGNAVEGGYKCIKSSWPERIIQTSGDRTFDYNCPSETPFCNEDETTAGNPQCCLSCLRDGDYQDCRGCTTIGSDVQVQGA